MVYAWGPGLELALAVVLLYVLPGTLYARWLLPDLSLLEQVVVGYGVGSSGFVASLFVLHLGFGVPLTAGVARLVVVALWLPLAVKGGRALATRGLDAVPRPAVTERRLLMAGLLGIVAAHGVFWAMYPHLKEGYFIPFHVDEYIHWANTGRMMEHASFEYPNAYFGGQERLHLRDENGFWVWSAGLVWLADLPMVQVATYEPLFAVGAMALAAAAYGRVGFGGDDGFGLEAGLLVVLIPTSTRLLGPAFYVPMPLVLAWALAAGVLARHPRKRVALPLVGLLAVGGLAVHSATSGVVALVAGWRLLLDAEDRRQVLGAAAVAGAFAAFFLLVVNLVPFLAGLWDSMIRLFTVPNENTNGLIDQPGEHFLFQLRWPLMVLFGLGAVTAFRRFRRDRVTLVLSLPPVLTLIILKDRWLLGHNSLYDRAFFYTFFLVLLLAGAGLAEVRAHAVRLTRALGRRLDREVRPHLAEAVRAGRRGAGVLRRVWWALRGGGAPRTQALVLGYVGLLVVAGGAWAAVDDVQPIRENQFFYRNVNENHMEGYLWIHDHPERVLGASKGIVQPLNGLPFAAASGLYTHAAEHPKHNLADEDAILQFTQNGCRDTELLERTGAQLVYWWCDDLPVYEEVHPQVHVYLPALNLTYRDPGFYDWNRTP